MKSQFNSVDTDDEVDDGHRDSQSKGVPCITGKVVFHPFTDLSLRLFREMADVVHHHRHQNVVSFHWLTNGLSGTELKLMVPLACLTEFGRILQAAEIQLWEKLRAW
jgi:hypothetical protein